MTANNLCNIILIYFAFALLGCSHTPNTENSSPIQRYNDYIAALSNETYVNLLKNYWVKSFVSEGLPLLMSDSEDNKLDRNSIIFSINFPKDMKSIIFKKMDKKNTSACVLVAGISEEDTPMIFNITYTMEQDGWLIKDVHATFLKQSESYPSQPDCSPVIP